METETNSEKLKILIKAKINPFIIISGFEKNNRNKKIRMTLNISWRDDKKLRWENLSFETSGKSTSWILSWWIQVLFKESTRTVLFTLSNQFRIR
jgi:hypothetical protein